MILIRLFLPASLQLQCDKSQITAHVGGEFILSCKYNTNRFLYSRKYWCRGGDKNTCEIVVDSEGGTKTSDTHRSHIIDAARRGLYVKVTNLQFSDAGAYWVGIDKAYADIMTSVKVAVTEGKNKKYAFWFIWTMYIKISITLCWLCLDSYSPYPVKWHLFKHTTCLFVPVPVSTPKLWPLTSLVDKPTCWGRPVTVRCGCTKGTGVRYSWYQNTYNKAVLLHHSADLHLHCGNVNEDSDYHCTASNDISSQQSDAVSVQVLMPADSDCIYVIIIKGKNRCCVVFSPKNINASINNTIQEAFVHNDLLI